MTETISTGSMRRSPITVSAVRLTEGEADSYRLEATLSGASSEGQVEVIGRLRNTQSGEIVQTRRRASVSPGVALGIVIEMQAPPGEYTPEVDAEYLPN